MEASEHFNHLPSASGMGAVVECPGSLFLKRDRQIASNEAIQGTIIHDKLYRHVKNKEPCPKEFKNHPIWEVLRAAREKRPELAWSLQRDGKCIVFGENIGRAYPEVIPTGTLYGSIDLFARNHEDKVAWIIDYKTGHGFVEAPQSNYQIITHALIARGFYGTEYTYIGMVVKPNDEVYWWQFSNEELDAHLARIFVIAKTNIHDHNQNYRVTGKHCQYCKSYNHCPEQNGILKRLSDGTALSNADSFEILHENVAEVAEKIMAYEIAIKKAKEKLQDYIDHNGSFKLKSGRWYGQHVTNRECINAYEALEYFRHEHGNPDPLSVGFEIKLTKQSLEDKLGRDGSKRVLNDLRRRGAIRKYPVITYRTLGRNKSEQEESSKLLNEDAGIDTEDV